MADFGLKEDTYGANYFRRRKSVTGSEEKVPIKWMAPESIENDIYNERTDVVSNLHLVHTEMQVYLMLCMALEDNIKNLCLTLFSIAYTTKIHSMESICT